MSRKIPLLASVSGCLVVMVFSIAAGRLAAAEPKAPQNAAGSLSGITLHSEVKLMAGTAVPTSIGTVSDPGLPKGARLFVKGLPKSIQVQPAGLAADKEDLVVPIGALRDAPAGRFEMEISLTHQKAKLQQRVAVVVEPFQQPDASRTCIRLVVPPGQPAQVEAGKPFEFRMDAVNRSLLPLPTQPHSDGRPMVGFVNSYIERVDGDQSIPGSAFPPKLPPSSRRGNMYWLRAESISDDGAQAPPGKVETLTMNSVRMLPGGLPPGKYRLEYVFVPVGKKDYQPGLVDNGLETAGLEFEVVAAGSKKK